MFIYFFLIKLLVFLNYKNFFKIQQNQFNYFGFSNNVYKQSLASLCIYEINIIKYTYLNVFKKQLILLKFTKNLLKFKKLKMFINNV